MVPKEPLFHCLYLGFWDNAAISAPFKCDISFEYDSGGDLVINWCYEQHFSFHNSVNFQATGLLNPQYNFHIIKPHIHSLTHTKHSQQWQTAEKSKTENWKRLEAKLKYIFHFLFITYTWKDNEPKSAGAGKGGQVEELSFSLS